MIRKGQRNGSTYWYCNDCKRYSSGRKKPSQEAIFNRYSQGTFTIKQLSEEFGISPSSVKRKLKDSPPKQDGTFTPKSGGTNGYHLLGKELWSRPFYGC